MKTHRILTTLRNATSPAARLAAWQNLPLWKRRKSLADYYDKTANLADRRNARIASSVPELSNPEAESPLLWLTGQDDPQVKEAYAGRIELSHRGWYADNYESETLETYAVTLTRFPHLVFYAVKDSCNGNLRVELSEWEAIDFSECHSDYHADDARRDAARAMIRSNDSSTEREADESREFYRKDQAERDIQENKETLKALRSEISALAHELGQPGNRANPDTPILTAARKQLCNFLRDRRELMRENQKLAAGL